MKPTTKTMYDYLSIYAKEEPNELLFFDEDRRYTVKETYNEVVAIANSLYANGIRASNRIALRATRSVDCTFLFFATQIMGAVVLLCDGNCKAEEYIKESGVEIEPDYVITNEEAGMDLSANGNWELKNCKTGEKVAFAIAYPALKEEIAFEPVLNAHALAMVIFTSGSTGKSKGVMLSQYNYINHQRNFKDVGGHLGNDSALQLLPLHHVFGITQINDAVIHRCPIFFPKSIDVDYVLQCIEKYKFTRFGFVPSYALAMADVKRAKGYDTSSLKVVVLAGAPSTKEQFEYIQDTLGLKIVPVYGQSECIGISGAGPYERDDKRASSVGKILPMNKGYVLDEKGNELPAGVEGEICVESPAIMLGYYGEDYMPLDEKGRLHTGDLGYLDEEGFLHITGRIKDIIIINGNNVSAARLENKLTSLPFIFNAAVVGVKDEKRGEAPLALVVLKEGESYDEEEVKKVFNKAEMPKDIVIVKEFPLTSSGKIDKQKIKETYQ
ncbi:MAG: acyl--CoA ligase [Clostridia bacterium]|nr:acyl--CoA ligase [Clostridia bacterium]